MLLSFPPYLSFSSPHNIPSLTLFLFLYLPVCLSIYQSFSHLFLCNLGHVNVDTIYLVSSPRSLYLSLCVYINFCLPFFLPSLSLSLSLTHTHTYTHKHTRVHITLRMCAFSHFEDPNKKAKFTEKKILISSCGIVITPHLFLRLLSPDNHTYFKRCTGHDIKC